MVWRLRTIFKIKIPLNDNENNSDEIFIENNYKKTVCRLRDSGLKNSSFTSADVAMLGY